MNVDLVLKCARNIHKILSISANAFDQTKFGESWISNQRIGAALCTQYYSSNYSPLSSEP